MKRMKKINKKGDISLWILLIGVMIFAGSLLIYMNKMENKLGDIGESTIKILNTFEATERLFFYMDASTEIASNKAEKTIIQNSGYLEQRFKGQIENPACGKLTYPVIDVEKELNECFPNYEQTIKTVYTRQTNLLFLKYDPFEIDPSQFETKITKGQNNVLIRTESISNLDMPIYSYIESYYRKADQTKESTKDINLVFADDNEYITSKKYLALNSFPREEMATKIVIHDTGTENVEETYQELYTGTKNFHYIIDKQGKVTKLTPEEKDTKHSSCEKSKSTTCQIENTDENSISIALINEIPAQTHTSAQIAALKKLIAEITLRNKGIELTPETLLLNNEIDTSRKDPAIDLKTQKTNIISDAKIIINERQPVDSTNVPVDTTNAQQGQIEGTGNTPTNSYMTGAALLETNIITGMATAPPDNFENLKCFNDVVTTKYFSPSCDGIIWASNAYNPKGWCYIPMKDRGFYEQVKCQGSGECNGRAYHYSDLSKQGVAQSNPLPEEFTRGKTASGTDPTPKRTVAAKWSCPGFKKNSKLYIYWGEDSEWNGYYQVEDVGSAINTCDHLDIYVGAGNDAVNNADFKSTSKDSKGNDYAKVCVLDPNFEMPDPDFSSDSDFVDIITGNSEVYYSHNIQMENITKLFDETKTFFSETTAACKSVSADKKNNCIEEKMKNAELLHDLKVEYCDKEEYQEIAYINSLPDPQNTGVISADYQNKILGTIIENPTIILDSGKQAEYMSQTNIEETGTQTPDINIWNNKKILVIGDSRISFGNPSFPDQLQELLVNEGILVTIDKKNYDACNTTIIKECLKGTEIVECKNSCREGANYNFPKIDLEDYDAVFIWGSRNDMQDSEIVITDLKEMYEYAKSNGKAVVAMTIAPGIEYKENTKKINEDFLLKNPLNVDYVIDTYNLLLDEATGDIKSIYVAGDGVHQNEEANKLIAQKIYDEVIMADSSSMEENLYPDLAEILIPTMNEKPIAASIIIKDSKGEIKINLNESALEWVDYSNKENYIFTEGVLLKKGDEILLNIKYDWLNKAYYVDNFSDISLFPENIGNQEFLGVVKKLGECATMEDTCDCKIEPTRILKEIKIENNSITNVQNGESAQTEFKISSQALQVDVSKGTTFGFIGNQVYWTNVDNPNYPECMPKRTYKYICSSLIGDESLGTIGYALKI
ncbi:MAG: N-acetylmuramoyl-L-alanine amidase [Candidatus Nanoarchaeia archaeon]